MPYYGDALPYYYGGPFSNHSSLMTGTGRTLHSPLGSTRYAPHLTTISESPLSALRRYSPAATITARPKRVIDTADIDVSTPRALTNSHNNDQRHRLRRDRPTIRIRSQALKDNPALREHYERHEKSVGELLVEKFLIKDKKSETEGEPRTKLYTQISLLKDDTTKEQLDELQEALQKRITRRMTRRKSSADVQMDREQLEREVLLAQAQADVLDTLVAQEQAEIEVETRMGTFIRKNLVRSGAPLTRSKHEIQSLAGDEEQQEDTRTKKLTKKIKKRKKTSDKPSPPGGSDLNSEHDLTRARKITKNESDSSFGDNTEMPKDGVTDDGGEGTRETSALSPSRGLQFKVEASNSVGDFSILWVNANAADGNEKQKRISGGIVEQFRDSVRLPAPKKKTSKIVQCNKQDAIIEEHQQIVVLPVKKRYVKDDARNSVYLTLKTQKNANPAKVADKHETLDRIEAIDDKIDQSRSPATTNGQTIGGESLTTPNSMANTAKGIPRQAKVNKVAKFRSKDITKSDVEVKSISELPGAGATGGKLGTKDARLQKSSGLNYGTGNSIANESISESSNRDENVESSNAFVGDRSRDEGCAKIPKFSENDEEKPEFCGIRDPGHKSKSIFPPTESTVEKNEKIPTKDGTNGISKRLWNNGAKEKIEKSLERAKNERRNLQKNNSSSPGDESKRLKASVTSRLDSSSTRDDVENTVDERDNEKDPLRKAAERGTGAAGTARILSSIAPSSNVVESVPNASTINFPDVENSLNATVNIHNGEFNAEKIENEGKKIAENITENGDSPLSRKITETFGQVRSGISKPIGVTDENLEVGDLGNLHKVKSPAAFGPAKKDGDLANVGNGDRVTDSLTKKTASGIDRTEKESENVVDPANPTRLRKNRKVLPLPSRNDATKIIASGSPDLEVVSDDLEKIQTTTKERPVIATDDDVTPSLNIDKSPNGSVENGTDIAIETKINKDSLAELRNGTAEINTEAIVAIDGSAKVDLKSVKKIDVTPAKKDEEIDFWGEIESREIDLPSKKNLVDNWVTDAGSGAVGASEPIISESRAKSDSSLETGAENETLVAGEKKSNRVKKKKKISENGGCGKKDQEKASPETIFELLKISSAADEKSRQQQAAQLEQRSEIASEETGTSVLDEEKIDRSLDIDRFDRNLSTIVEESLSPVSEETTKNLAASNLETSTNIVKVEEKVETKLDTARKLSTTGENQESSGKTTPEVPAISQDATVRKIRRVPVPTIKIVEPSGTAPEDGVLPEDRPEQAARQDEAEEDPGTPTNEKAAGETINEALKNISKWQGLADLSLDEPDKDIGPEINGEATKKDSSKKKKKVGSSKKASRKNSVDSNSTKSTGTNSQDSSKKKKLVRKKKSSTSSANDGEKNVEQRSESKVSNTSETTLKPGGLNLNSSPIHSGRNSPKQRPLDLIKMFYTTPVSLLTATPRDLSKVRRAKVKKRKHSSRTASASSNSTGSTRSTESTGTAESTASTEHEDEIGQKRISSTRSNDSGFDGSPRLSNCDMACHRKCEKLTGNLCGLNQKLVAEALQELKRAPSQSSDNQRNSDGSDHHASGRITPPATNLPRFKKYTVMDFNFLKVLGKGSFGKVLLAELRRTDCVYAVKCLKKDVVLEDDDVECTLIERKVLTLATRHPYLCHLFCTFQTDSHLFFVMEYLNGGDLMFHIQKSGRFPESRARFYAAEIWSGLNFLHKKGIVYRDLKLDNVLLDFEGHIRIADFGMCKLQIFLDRTADTFCGTPDYMAPEIIKGLKYNQAVDWWSFGVLLYEMLTGQSPFSGCDEDELFWSICNERPFIPRYLSQEAMDILVCLLEKDSGKRPPAHEIANHPFFHSLQWDRLERRQLEAPFKPALDHTLDTRYFDTAFTAERPRLTPVPQQILSSMDQTVFRGFSYTNPNATD